MERHHRLHFTVQGLPAHVEEFVGSIRWVDVRVFLERDDDVGACHQGAADAAVQVQFYTDHSLRTHQLADLGCQVPLAVVVTLGNHRTMLAEQHQIDRHGRLQIGENLASKSLVHRLNGRACRLGKSGQALDDFGAGGLCFFPPDDQRHGKKGRAVLGGITVVQHCLFEIGQAGRHIGESVGLRAQAGNKYFHESDPCLNVGSNISLLVPKHVSY